MAYDGKSSSPNKIFGKQLLTPEQIQRASVTELKSDPLLWAAFKRGWDERFLTNQVKHNSNRAEGNNGRLYDANYRQNGNVRENNSMNKKSFSQQYRLQKTVTMTQTNCKLNETKLMETDN